MKAVAVIGSGWGDEGKGKLTSFLVQEHSSEWVIRFNGGAQAGHTVEMDDGTRHVFHHFGSGTLQGAKTYFTHHCLVNPILFLQEWDELRGKTGQVPTFFYHPECPVTTPYDMVFNQAKEKFLGVFRHGSCGVGINETITREDEGVQFRLPNWSAASSSEFDTALREVQEYYDEQVRLLFPELSNEYKETMAFIHNPGVESRFRKDVNDFLSRTKAVRRPDFGDRPVVFEGAQGLALDQHRGDFPHVTRSNTGLLNVVDACRFYGFDLEEVVYVTRAYSTRHGNGHLPGQVEGLIYPGIIDTTNAPNPWQGSIRYAPLDVDMFWTRVHADVESVNHFHTKTSVALTCVDQVDDKEVLKKLYDFLAPDITGFGPGTSQTQRME